MSTSTVKLYPSTSTKPWLLTPGKLFKVDNMTSYLSTNFSDTLEEVKNVQYFKHKLETSIKLDMSQKNAQPTFKGKSFKYMSIQNVGEPIVYYFVKKTTWTSENCVLYELVMDVLNSLVEGLDYKFKRNTRIIREHKSRLTLTDNKRFAVISGTIDNIGWTPQVDDIAWVNLSPDNTFDARIQFLSVDIDHETFAIEVLSGSIDLGTLNLYSDSRYEDADEIEFTCNDIEYDKDVVRNIDYVPENINPMLQCGSGEGYEVGDDNSFNTSWYLLYRNQNDPDPDSYINPVDCYLIPEEDVPVTMGVITNGRIYASNLDSGKVYYPRIDASHTITFNGITINNLAYPQRRMVVVKRGDNENILINAIIAQYDLNSSSWVATSSVQYETKFIELNGLPYPYAVYTAVYTIDSYCSSIYGNENESWDTDETPRYLDSVRYLDKTDSKNIKLIKLPYCPYNFPISNGKLSLDNADWTYVSLGALKVLKLNDLNTKLQHTFNNDDATPLHVFHIGSLEDVSPSINDLRQSETLVYESKLYNSEFHQPKLIYDSFTYTFELEKLDAYPYYFSDTLNITFTMTRTINSKFMFEFKGLYFRYADQNYQKVVTIARNNEAVLYNVPYINYIRNGFNYDVKAKNISNASNWVGLGMSALATGVSFLAPGPLKVAGIVGGMISVAQNVKNTIVSTMQGEENLKQKLLQSQNQTASVSGSDDVDLMSEYSGNRLKYLVYQPSPNMKHLLQELFFYAGYNSGRMGVPTHNNRVNFDYLECDAIFEDDGVNLPQEILEELKNCFKHGVTYIHKTSRATNAWDIKQEYENWEVELMED